ncbi:MAG: hypothetical protein CL902_00560 [Dehalococcoidia bacterium]|nr:hypothetical protein [Dehalococcoidia bacterium]
MHLMMLARVSETVAPAPTTRHSMKTLVSDGGSFAVSDSVEYVPKRPRGVCTGAMHEMLFSGSKSRQRLVDQGDTFVQVEFCDGLAYVGKLVARRPDVGRLYFDIFFPYDSTRICLKLGYDNESARWSEYISADKRHPDEIAMLAH